MLPNTDLPASNMSLVPPMAGPVPSVRIPLEGTHGRGHFMTLDEADWQHVREAWGESWTLMSNGHRKTYVVSRRRALTPLTDQPGGSNTTRLSRLLMGAKRGERVLFQDCDSTNLTRANLLLLDRREAALWLAAKEIAGMTVH
jgi:hypothetical protein